jgi:hypothetical protein
MTSPFGVQLTLLIGPVLAAPAPPLLTESLRSVEVTHNDEGRSGFQLTFHAGRGGPLGVLDYPQLLLPLLRVFNRVILIVTIGAVPRVLMDGVVTNQQLAPGSEPGAGTISVTGEDVSVMMDLEEKAVDHPAQNEYVIANKLILSYAQYGLVPLVVPPLSIDFPLPINRTPIQHGTDLAYLKWMAQNHGYVFYIVPGPLPFANVAYWGPPIRVGFPQRALSVNLGASTNVDSITFQNNALAPTLVEGQVYEGITDSTLPVQTFLSMRFPLAAAPALVANLPNVRRQQLGDTRTLNYIQAYAKAQAITDSSVDNVVTAQGTLDALRYGDLLAPRALVGLRGVGFTFDGMYYVKRVTHSIRKGEYKQGFTLTREGTGAILPVVRA